MEICRQIQDKLIQLDAEFVHQMTCNTKELIKVVNDEQMPQDEKVERCKMIVNRMSMVKHKYMYDYTNTKYPVEHKHFCSITD